MTKLYPIFPFIISILLLVMGVFVYRNNQKQYSNRIFLGLCLTSSCWLFFYSIAYIVQNEHIAFIFLKIGYSGVVFIPITVFHYTLEFLNFQRVKKIAHYNYFFGTFCVLIIWTTPLIINNVKKYFWGFYPIGGILHPFFLAYFLSLLTMSFVFLLYIYIYKQKQITPSKKIQIKYLLIAYFIYDFASTDFLANYNLAVYPFGYLPAFLFILIIGYTIVKYRLMEINIVITRVGIFVMLYSLVLGIPFLIGYYTQSWIFSTIVAVVFATMGPIVYRVLQRRAEDLILAEQRRYQKILTQAAEGMSREHDLKRLLKLIVYLVVKTVKIKFALIFLYDDEFRAYQLRAIRDNTNILSRVKFKKDNPLVKFLIEKKNPVLFDELPENIKLIVGNEFKNGLIVQSFIGDKMLGFMLLGEKNNGKMYSIDDINVFRILAHQSSLAIENCLFLDESKRAQERIFAAEKLASIGGMADGVAHQMRNRLNVFSVVAGTQQFGLEDLTNAHTEYFSAHPDAKAVLDELMTGTKAIQDNVKRSAEMLNGILNFAKSDEKMKMFSEFSLKKIVDASTEVIKTKHQIADFNLLQTDYGQSDNIYGVETQLRECVYNLLDNAYEAIKEKIDYHLKGEEKAGFVPKISLKLNKKDDKYTMEFEDNGIGIKEEHKHKIFSPFFTTKPSVQSGAGIGMYVVKRMVEENHHGRIRFESQYGQGTRVVIELPNLGTKVT